jgi:hypothetical protein
MLNDIWKMKGYRPLALFRESSVAYLLTSDWSAFTLSSIEKREDIYEQIHEKKKRADMLQVMPDLLILRALRQGP